VHVTVLHGLKDFARDIASCDDSLMYRATFDLLYAEYAQSHPSECYLTLKLALLIRNISPLTRQVTLFYLEKLKPGVGNREGEESAVRAKNIKTPEQLREAILDASS
jgi:hypothetical protein